MRDKLENFKTFNEEIHSLINWFETDYPSSNHKANEFDLSFSSHVDRVSPNVPYIATLIQSAVIEVANLIGTEREAYVRGKIRSESKRYEAFLDRIRIKHPELNKITESQLRSVYLNSKNKYLHNGEPRKVYVFAELVNIQLSYFGWLFEELNEAPIQSVNPKPDIFKSILAYKIYKKWTDEGLRLPAIFYFLKKDDFLTDSSMTCYQFCKEIGGDADLRDKEANCVNPKTSINYNRIKTEFM